MPRPFPPASPGLLRRARCVAALAAVLALSGATDTARAQLSFSTTFTGTAPSPAAETLVNASLSTLAGYFTSPSPFTLTVSVTWNPDIDSLGDGVASTFWTRNTGNPAIPRNFYAQGLYRYRFGNPSNPRPTDLNINLSTDFNWDYTQATPVDKTAYSLSSVVYHEALHAMGFTSQMRQDGEYQLTAGGIRHPTIFTTFMTDAAGTPFTSLTAPERSAAMTAGSGGIFFDGPRVRAANGGAPLPLYAPTVWDTGSSGGSHVDPSVTGSNMRPKLKAGEFKAPTIIDLAVMADIGWGVRPDLAAVPEPSAVFLLLGGAAPPLLARGIRGRRRRTATARLRRATDAGSRRRG